MKRIYFTIFIVTFLYSCGKVNDSINDVSVILKSSLEETKTSFFDLFERAELIPLETTDQSLIKSTRKVDCYDDTLYVFDDDLFAVFIFDGTGKYLNKVHKIGQGPGEYAYIYDFCVDGEKRTINMLSPLGVHYVYDFDTQFVKSYNLPTPPDSHYRFGKFSEESYVYWSMIGPNGEYRNNNLNLVSLEQNKNLKHFGIKDHCHTQLYTSFPFYNYKDSLFFMRPFSNDVYLLTEDSAMIAYSWNFGKETMSIDVVNHKYPEHPDVNQANMEFYNMFDNGEVKEAQYCYVCQNQTDKYYYTRVRFAHNVRKNLFYDKSSNRTMFFEKVTEGISFNPIYFSNEYLIFQIEPNQKDMLLPVLIDSEKAKLENIDEADNPILVKCYFK